VKLRYLVVGVAVFGAAIGGLGASALLQGASGATGTSHLTGYDVSYPQCGAKLPGGGTLAVVGVTNGLPWSTNPCLASEFAWASRKPQAAEFYMNTANPFTASSHWAARAGTGPRKCANLADPASQDCAYNYGWNSALDAVQRAAAATTQAIAGSHAWWLDVETGNSWNGTTAANAADLQGSVDYLRAQGVGAIGIYSTGFQWGQVTGGYQVGAKGSLPAPTNWVAGASSARDAGGWCRPSYSFSGGRVTMVQYPSGSFDGDLIC
jgi:hypothetical protein